MQTTTTGPASRYVELGELGTGGMGRVCRAYDGKLHREVALKRVRADILDDHGEERLLREALAMARVSHPNVVAIYDAEIDARGVVLAMEFVAGETLRRWLKQRHDWREIVDVFVEAGRGLEAAHQAGLVHRDFKPGNVILTPERRAKVTDFGLVRTTPTELSTLGESSPGDAPERESGSIVGTPAYIAPEQHDAGRADPRADQFAFCVALWEALTGTRPYRGDLERLAALKRRGPPAWPRPDGVPRAIGRALERGLAPDPNHRWPSMGGLLDRLEQCRRRARLRPLTVGVAIGLAGLGAFVGAREREEASLCTGGEAAMAALWNEDRRAGLERAMSGTGVPFATQAWARAADVVDAYAARWTEIHAEACWATSRGDRTSSDLDRQVACLGRGRAALEQLLEVFEAPNPELVAEANRLAAGLPALERCTDLSALAADVAPPSNPVVAHEVARLQEELAMLRVLRGAGRFTDVEARLVEMVPRAEEIGYAPLVASLRALRGWVHDDLGRYPEAAAELEFAYDLALQSSDDRTAAFAASALLFVIGTRMHDVGRARPWAVSAETLARRVEPDGELHGNALAFIAEFDRTRGDYARGLQRLDEALRIRRRVLGPDAIDVAETLHELSLLHQEQDDLDRAAQLQLEALEIYERKLGPEHPDLANAYNNLGSIHYRAERFAESERAWRRALAIRTRVLAPDHPDLALSYNNLGLLLFRSGAYDEAADHHRRALELRERTYGERSIEAAMSLGNLGRVRKEQGRFEEAEALLARNLAIFGERLEPGHPMLGVAWTFVAQNLVASGKPRDALAAGTEAVRILEAALGPESAATIDARLVLGEAMVELGQAGGARAFLEPLASACRRGSGTEPCLARVGALEARIAAASGEHARALELGRAALRTFEAGGPMHVGERERLRAWLESR